LDVVEHLVILVLPYQVVEVWLAQYTVGLSGPYACSGRAGSGASVCLSCSVPVEHDSGIPVDENVHLIWEVEDLSKEPVQVQQGARPQDDCLETGAADATGQHLVDVLLALIVERVPRIGRRCIRNSIWAFPCGQVTGEQSLACAAELAVQNQVTIHLLSPDDSSSSCGHGLSR